MYSITRKSFDRKIDAITNFTTELSSTKSIETGVERYNKNSLAQVGIFFYFNGFFLIQLFYKNNDGQSDSLEGLSVDEAHPNFELYKKLEDFHSSSGDKSDFIEVDPNCFESLEEEAALFEVVKNGKL